MVPTISGAVANQTVASGDTIQPFQNVTVSDPNPYVYDTLTIALLDADGNPTDANGTLSLAPDDSGATTFTRTDPGVYILADLTPPSENTVLTGLNTQLPHVTFNPSGSGTTRFSILDTSHDMATSVHTITDDTTTVIASGAGPTTVVTAATVTPPDEITTPSTEASEAVASQLPTTTTSDTITVTSDKVNILAETPNVFIKFGIGSDAADANGGLDLDGSTSVAADGSYTFNVDHRATLTGFDAGDTATILGVSKDDFSLGWVDRRGGAALHIAGNGGRPDVLKFAGYSTADVSSGKLSVSFGHQSDGTPCAVVQAH